MHALDRSLGTSLQDAAAPLLTLLLQLRQEESGESDALRSSLEAAFADFERRASAADYDPQTLQRSKSILAAFADELLQRSMPAMREAWGERPLAAPSNFAEVLDDARVAAGSGRVELLELCLTVLGLGFRGPYGDREGASRTRALMLELVQEIDAARKLRDTALLSPDAKHCQAIGTRVRHIPIWVMASAAAILVLILYYSFDSLVQARLHALGEVVWGK